MDNAVPQGARAACIAVAVYSVVCLFLGLLLFVLLYADGHGTKYVTLLAICVSINSVASIMQQVYYAFQWRQVKSTQLQQAKLSLQEPYLAASSLTTGFNLACVEIQLYCSTLVAVFAMCWATALAKSIYNLPLKSLTGWEGAISVCAKILAVTLAALFLGLSYAEPVRRNVVAFVALRHVLIIASFAIGIVLNIMIIAKYIHVKHTLKGMQDSNTFGTTSSASHRHCSRTRPLRGMIDKVLLLRFSIGFLILLAYEVMIITFQFTGTRRAARLAKQDEPDFLLSTCVTDIVLSLPIVSGSLVLFALFGTTAHFRERYSAALRTACCCSRTRTQDRRRSDETVNMWQSLNSLEPKSNERLSGDARASSEGETRFAAIMRDSKGFFRVHTTDGKLAPHKQLTQPWRSVGLPQP
ncbi:hypothetical protein BAUCODRAFT_355907 [Baudoinia panamericana UAMH 10762]|uniref:Uncharacterized protein n=1 Tax=Baudoinia panamericana (strain UAMH 10762) TaxID=717646 RepID=M2NKH0_BAUPA|nr:uncharacterized protein BAUCODRAFT_355907 [Baudoinia panamericana UAMH 10762]EMC99934.1 hypothetical protein BAUCODRAFT_355907 [Baudoinia panamericana UAMH 10762]